MKLAALLMLGVIWGSTIEAQAQTQEGGVQSFQQGGDAWRRQDGSEEKAEISQNIADAMGATAMDNIKNSEQVFCYQVATKPAGYKGYTIDNVAITGFCGVVQADLKELIVKQFLATPENISDEIDRCVIKPRLMLRFVKGVDFTDILLSAPCHSFTMFYGGKVKSYNFKPAAEIIDVMVDAFREKTIDFVSPALLRQLLPIGVAQTPEQKEMLQQQRGGAVRNWDDKQAQPEAPKAKTGWNNLN